MPAETSQFSPASRRIEAPRPSAAEAMAGADFRNVPFLARFMTETGRISPRRRSGLQVSRQLTSTAVFWARSGASGCTLEDTE